MSAQGAGGGGAAEQNPGQGARPAQQVQGILSLVPAGPQLVPAAAQRRGGGRPRGALNQSTRRANAATAKSAAFLGRFLAAASAPPRDLAEEGLAAAKERVVSLKEERRALLGVAATPSHTVWLVRMRRAGRQGGARHARAVRAPMCHGALYWEPG